MACMYGTPTLLSSTDVPASKSLSAVHDCHNCLNGDAAISMNVDVANEVGMAVVIGMSVHRFSDDTDDAIASGIE